MHFHKIDDFKNATSSSAGVGIMVGLDNVCQKSFSDKLSNHQTVPKTITGNYSYPLNRRRFTDDNGRHSQRHLKLT